MGHSGLNLEDVLMKRLKLKSDDDDEIASVLKEGEYSESFVKELQQRNLVLLEALRKVKMLVERLMLQNKGLKKRVIILEQEYKEQQKKGVKMVSAARYTEMKTNADELARSLPKLLKLIKLLNAENKLLKDKSLAIENEFSDMMDERNDLKTRLVGLNEKNQLEVVAELTELFPTVAIAAKAAGVIAESAVVNNGLVNDTTPEIKSIAQAASDSTPTIKKQAKSDLSHVSSLSNEQISKLIDLVVKINDKIENLSGTMVIAAPGRKRGKVQLDLADAISEGEMGEGDERPERPDLEDILDDILISS